MGPRAHSSHGPTPPNNGSSHDARTVSQAPQTSYARAAKSSTPTRRAPFWPPISALQGGSSGGAVEQCGRQAGRLHAAQSGGHVQGGGQCQPRNDNQGPAVRVGEDAVAAPAGTCGGEAQRRPGADGDAPVDGGGEAAGLDGHEEAGGDRQAT